MSQSPYTTKRFEQFRGPQSSEDYNQRIEENFKDLVYLYNKAQQVDNDLNVGYLAFLKELLGLNQAIANFETRLAALEAASNSVAFTSSSQIDNDRFNSTAFNVNSVDRCTYKTEYGLLTLPLVTGSSLSKIKYTNADGTYSVPPSLEMVVTQIATSADNTSSVIDTSQPFNAVIGQPGKVWDRNVIASSPNLTSGAQMYLYIKIPSDLSSVPNTNCLSFLPFPSKTVDVLEISYATDPNIILGGTANTGWTLLNQEQSYFQAPGAAGNVAPGAWSGDEILNSGAKAFYFDPLPITALRIKLRQQTYFIESTKNIYTYGLSKLDVRYDKFLTTGKTIIRMDARSTDTISSVTSITPQIWNIPEYLIPSVFSYRVIWETSFNSGSYTLTPVPLSKRVWIEVTLNQDTNQGTPALSGLIMKYT